MGEKAIGWPAFAGRFVRLRSALPVIVRRACENLTVCARLFGRTVNWKTMFGATDELLAINSTCWRRRKVKPTSCDTEMAEASAGMHVNENAATSFRRAADWNLGNNTRRKERWTFYPCKWKASCQKLSPLLTAHCATEAHHHPQTPTRISLKAVPHLHRTFSLRSAS